VTEINTLRDPQKSPDAAALFGNMTNQQLVDSIKRVTDIPDSVIYKTVYAHGGGNDLADKLVQRKHDLAEQAKNITVAEISKPMPAAQVAAATHEVKDIPDHEFAKLSSAEKVKHLLMKGTTTNELKTKLGWKSIGIPANAAALNLKLEKTQQNGVAFYKGTPMTAAEIAAAKGEKAAKKAAAPATAPIAPEPDKVWAEELKKAQALSTAQPKTSHSFNNELDAKGVKNGGLTYHHNGRDLTISAPTPQAQAMAEVAKNHPEWTLNKDAKSTYTAPKSAFEDTKHLVPPAEIKIKPPYESNKPFVTAAGHDINTPEGSFKQSMEEHGVQYTYAEGMDYHHFDIAAKDLAKANEIAKWHPKVDAPSRLRYALHDLQSWRRCETHTSCTPGSRHRPSSRDRRRVGEGQEERGVAVAVCTGGT
jgi:hypothetical protein